VAHCQRNLGHGLIGAIEDVIDTSAPGHDYFHGDRSVEPLQRYLDQKPPHCKRRRGRESANMNGPAGTPVPGLGPDGVETMVRARVDGAPRRGDAEGEDEGLVGLVAVVGHDRDRDAPGGLAGLERERAACQQVVDPDAAAGYRAANHAVLDGCGEQGGGGERDGTPANRASSQTEILAV